MATEILIILGLIFLNGIFAMAEISVVAARKTKLEHDAAQGDKKSKIALKLANNPGKFLSTVQIGITLVGILTGVYSGAGIANKLAVYFNQYPTIAPYSNTVAITVVVIAITFLSIIFGELIPKQVGIIRSETVARSLAQPMNFLSVMAHPFVWLLTMPGNLLIKWLRIKPSEDSKVTEDEIKAIIKEGTVGGEIQEIEQDIVERVFYLGDRKVGSLMTHRTDLVWIDVNQSENEIKDRIISELHSVYPVCDGNIDKIQGIVQIKDLFTSYFRQEKFEIRDYLKEPLFVLENNSAYEVLEKFRESKTHSGLVVDEYGSILGLVTLNNILEALVGEIPAEDGAEYEITEREDGSWLIDAQIPFYDFLQRMEIQYFDKTKIKYNTLGGLALNVLHHIPHTGEKFTWRDFEFEIVDMDGNRIDKMLVKKVEKD
ncbi:MAG TPA: hemolysin family protein [Bacteroidales bacterium]|nr:hemolysin family protein [Bacteroidales bacterium]